MTKHEFRCSGFLADAGWHRWTCRRCDRTEIATSSDLRRLPRGRAECHPVHGDRVGVLERLLVALGIRSGYDCLAGR